MRKLFLLVIGLLLSFSVYSDELVNVVVRSEATSTKVIIKAKSPFDYQTTEYQDPLRLALDLANTTYTWSERNLLISDSVLVGLRFSHRGDNTRIVIDRVLDTRYQLRKSGNTLVIEFKHKRSGGEKKFAFVGSKPKPQIKVSKGTGQVGIINRLMLREAGNQLKIFIDGEHLDDYKSFVLSEPERMVIDFKAVLGPKTTRKQIVNRGNLTEIRLAQFQSQPDPIARVVFQFESGGVYRLDNLDGQLCLIVELKKGKSEQKSADKDDAPVLELPTPVHKKDTVQPSPPLPPPPAPPVTNQERRKTATPEPRQDIFKQSVSLNYKNKPANQILDMLARKYKLKYKGERLPRNKISIQLRGVSVFKAITEILNLCSFTFTREGSALILARVDKPQEDTLQPFILRPDFQDEKRAQKVILDISLVQFNSLLKDRLKLIWQPFRGSYSKRLVIGLPKEESEFKQTVRQMLSAKEIKLINGTIMEIKNGEKDNVILGQRGEFLIEKHSRDGEITLEKSYFDLGYKMVVRATIRGDKIKLWFNVSASVIPVAGVMKKPLVIRREMTQEIDVANESSVVIGGIVRAEDKLIKEEKSLISKIPLVGKMTSQESLERIPLEVMTIVYCRVE